MYRYTAYGLSIHSVLAMPELMPCDVAADVHVRYGRLGGLPDIGEAPYAIRADGDGVYCFMKQIGGVLIRDGCEIVVDPLPGAEARGFRFLVTGFALGMLLHQRGLLALHASAVAVEHGVVAFLGWKGMGKSTTAASLHGRGHPLVTDDLLALEVAGACPDVMVIPGFPHLKLWPEAAAASLGDDPDTLPKLHPDGAKRSRAIVEGFQQTPLPLRCVYVLAYASEEDPLVPAVEALSPHDAFLEMIRHSYALLLMGEKGTNHLHLRQCTQLAQQIPVRRLTRKPSIDDLPNLAAYIEEDLARHVPGPAEAPAARQPIFAAS